jgi:hypothetical protein
MTHGTPDIIWQNNLEPNATPRFELIFLRYQNFKPGAQRTNKIVGAEALESYLLELGFDPKNARNHVERLGNERSISIDSVAMPDEFSPAYAN